VPPFGPFPRELSDVYPLNLEVPDRLDRRAYEQAVAGVCRLVEANPDTEFTVTHDGWPADVLAGLPDGVPVRELGVDDPGQSPD